MKNTNRLIFAFLAAVALVFAAGCSDDSDSDGNTISASDLAGTTWTCSVNVEDATWTFTLEFNSNGTVTSTTSITGSDAKQTESYTSYSVSDDGSTVTLYSNGEAKMTLTYSSGQLVGDAEGNTKLTYTKKS